VTIEGLQSKSTTVDLPSQGMTYDEADRLIKKGPRSVASRTQPQFGESVWMDATDGCCAARQHHYRHSFNREWR